MKSVVQRARDAGLSDEDCASLDAIIDTLEWVSSELEDKTLTLARLRSLFGIAGSETSRKVLPKPAGDSSADDSTEQTKVTPSGEGDAAPKRKGHGRNGARDYVGAEVIKVPHESLCPGDACPECEKGKLYEQKDRPHLLVRMQGQAPIKATVYEKQTLR
jgi:hypothetical protein